MLKHSRHLYMKIYVYEVSRWVRQKKKWMQFLLLEICSYFIWTQKFFLNTPLIWIPLVSAPQTTAYLQQKQNKRPLPQEMDTGLCWQWTSLYVRHIRKLLCSFLNVLFIYWCWQSKQRKGVDGAEHWNLGIFVIVSNGVNCLVFFLLLHSLFLSFCYWVTQFVNTHNLH